MRNYTEVNGIIRKISEEFARKRKSKAKKLSITLRTKTHTNSAGVVTSCAALNFLFVFWVAFLIQGLIWLQVESKLVQKSLKKWKKKKIKSEIHSNNKKLKERNKLI